MSGSISRETAMAVASRTSIDGQSSTWELNVDGPPLVFCRGAGRNPSKLKSSVSASSADWNLSIVAVCFSTTSSDIAHLLLLLPDLGVGDALTASKCAWAFFAYE